MCREPYEWLCPEPVEGCALSLSKGRIPVRFDKLSTH